MSLLAPGVYLRSKLREPHYDVRAEDGGGRILTVTMKEASFFISSGQVLGLLDGRGNLRYLTTHLSAKKLRSMLDRVGQDSSQSAEDNTTTVLDGKTYRFHMRRVMAWAR